ncbi:hypothetical protein OKW30_004238 [Paraburkholderia sp. Clong3]
MARPCARRAGDRGGDGRQRAGLARSAVCRDTRERRCAGGRYRPRADRARRDAAYRAGRAATRGIAERDARRGDANFRRAQRGRGRRARRELGRQQRPLADRPARHAREMGGRAGGAHRALSYVHDRRGVRRAARAHDSRPHDDHARSPGYRSISARRKHRAREGPGRRARDRVQHAHARLDRRAVERGTAGLSVGPADRARTRRPRSGTRAARQLARAAESAADRQRRAVRALPPRARAIRLSARGAGQACNRTRPVARRRRSEARPAVRPGGARRADRRQSPLRRSRNKEPTCNHTSICPHRTCRTRV